MKMRALDQDLVNASQVCRHWREFLTSSPHLWTEFKCKTEALTRAYLTRSESLSIDVIAGPSSEIQAVTTLRLATDRLRSFTLQLQPLQLVQVFRALSTPAPVLEHLEVSFTDDAEVFNSPIPVTFGGSTPALKSLHLNKINTQLNFSKFPALTRLTLVTADQLFDVSELFHVFMSARLLEEVSVTFSHSTRPIPENQAIIYLPRMRHLSFSNTRAGEFPSRLLSPLRMNSVKEVKLDINLPREDTRTLRDFLPPFHCSSLEVENLELDVPDARCNILFSGPGGVVSIHASRGESRRHDDGFQSHWLNSIEPTSIMGVNVVTLRNYSPSQYFDQASVLRLLRRMDGVQTLIVEQCNEKSIIEALSPLRNGSVLFPGLEYLTFGPTKEPTAIFLNPKVEVLARGRVSSNEYITFSRSDIESLRRLVS